MVHLPMTDVPDIARTAVVAPINRRLDPTTESFRWHSLLQTSLLVWKFFVQLKLIGIQFLVQYVICLREAGLLTIHFMFWTGYFPYYFEVKLQLWPSVLARNNHMPFLMITAGDRLTSVWRLIFGGLGIGLEWTGICLPTDSW